MSWFRIQSRVDWRRVHKSGDDTIVTGKSELMIERLHHTDERKLGRAVVRHVTESEQTRAASDAHNVTVIATQHAGQELAQNPIASE